eukprot:6198358-Pleurochrysis_carterae.AAC.2
MRNGVLDGLVHLCIRLLETVWLEHRVPSEVVRATRGHNDACGAPIESDRRVARPIAIGEDALRVCTLVFIRSQEIIQASVACFLQKPARANA